jgi:NAD+ synthase (glutamine-hydrolysing)
MQTLIEQIRKWFDENNLDHAVIGYSGGIDSATTAALIHRAEIPITLVQVCLENHTLSSRTIMMDFLGDIEYAYREGIDSPYTRWEFIRMPDISYLRDAGKEAALPIIRNAYFYGVAADLRDDNKRPVVVGTINFDEAAYLGFWGKASDGAQDFYPISHLHKSEVYALAKELGVPQEIIDAVPSGDLQYSGDLNDYKMIGATYDQIEGLAKFVDSPKVKTVIQIMEFIENNIDDPLKFVKNINRNSFKYNQPFPNVHVNGKLELFRKRAYPTIMIAASNYEFLSNLL